MSFLLPQRALCRSIASPLRQAIQSRNLTWGSSLARPRYFGEAKPSLWRQVNQLKAQPQTRFFSSTNWVKARRPYSHRDYGYSNGGGKSFLGFLDRIPRDFVFWGILTVNGVVFVMWYLSAQRWKIQRDPSAYQFMYNNFTDSWKNISSGRVWTIITSCFSHESIPHILFNGFTFYFMSRPVLDMLGSRQFVFLYFGAGIFANIVSMSYGNLIKGRDNPSLGASAAIYGVVSYLACVAPKMTFQLYGIIPIPAWLAVAGIFSYDTYSAIKDKQKGTDTAGHVGGLIAGMGYYLLRRHLGFW